MSTHTIKCGSCNISVQGPSDPQPQSYFACPTCGMRDTYENIMSEVKEQATEQAAASINRMLGDAMSGSSFMKVTSHYRPSGKRYRFVIDLSL